MPWRLRWEIYMITLGVITLVLAIIVEIISRDVAAHLLAVIALAGGIAIILNALPHGDNGSGGRWRDYNGERGRKAHQRNGE